LVVGEWGKFVASFFFLHALICPNLGAYLYGTIHAALGRK